MNRQKVLMNEVAGVRAFGSTGISLAYVAAGRLDAHVETAVEPWHCAAGLLMVREAGGFVSDLTGKDKVFLNRSIVAGNEDVHRRLVKLLAA
jgi:myo-inositol-1(or 4)-monophosphatase